MKTRCFPLYLLFLTLCAFFATTACSDDEGISPDNPKDYAVRGQVEKGPFISGSTIDMQPLDDRLNPVGTIYTTTIGDDAGSFEFPSQSFTSPYVQLSANGYFFNEVKGELSKGPIRLEAIVDITAQPSATVNLLTHLKAGRMRKLTAGSLSVKESGAEAQKELLTCFGLQKYDKEDVSRFSMTAGTDEAGALIAVSSALLLDRSEAELTEYVSRIGQEFAADGRLSDQTKKQYAEDCQALILNDISRHIVERYGSLGKEVTVKPLKYYIDWDNDGIAGNEFSSEDGLLSFEKDTLFVPAAGGSYKISILAGMPFDFPQIPEDILTPEQFLIFSTANIALTKKIAGKELQLEIAPATAYFMRNKPIHIASLDGGQKATLVIVQEGDKNTSPFTEDGINYLTFIVDKTAQATYYARTTEALYTNTYRTESGDDPFETHTLTSRDYTVNEAWSAFYYSLSRLRQIQQNLTESPEWTVRFDFMTAALYYELAVLWENPVYVINADDLSISAPQKNSRELFSLLKKKLEGRTDDFENKKNAFDKLEGYVFFSNDFARLVLAKIYLYEKEYAQARTLLNAIVTDGHYRLTASRAEALRAESPELIWGYRNLIHNTNLAWADISYRPITLDEYLSFGTYTEVLLSLAECEYGLGNVSGANGYLNQVASKRGLQTAGDFLSALRSVWASELKGTGSYFAFLKRNGLAQKTLGIEPFRLVFPIPFDEIMKGGYKQNPGY